MNLNDPLVMESVAPATEAARTFLLEMRKLQRREADSMDQSETGALAIGLQILAGEGEAVFNLEPQQMVSAFAFAVAAFIAGFEPLTQRTIWEAVGRGVAQTLAERHRRNQQG